MPGFLLAEPKNELHKSQGRRARYRLLFRDKVKGQSSSLTPGGDKRVRSGELSRGFYRQLRIFRECEKEFRGVDLLSGP